MALTQDEFFDEEFYRRFPELQDRTRQAVEGMFPLDAPIGEDVLSDDQRQRLAELETRAQRLQPLQMPQRSPSTRIPGNPYSYDITPITDSILGGLTKVVNAERQRRMLGDPEEAERLRSEAREVAEQAPSTISGAGSPAAAASVALQRGEDTQRVENLIDRAEEAEGVVTPMRRLISRKQKAAEQQERRSDVMAELFPNLASQMVDIEGRLQEQAGEQEFERETREDEQEFEKELLDLETEAAIDKMGKEFGFDRRILEEELQNDIEFLREEEELGVGSSRDPFESVGVVGKYIGQVEPYIKTTQSLIEELESQYSLYQGEPEVQAEIDDRLDELRERQSELQQWRTKAFREGAEGNLYSPELLEDLDEIIGSGSSQRGSGRRVSPTPADGPLPGLGGERFNMGIDW